MQIYYSHKILKLEILEKLELSVIWNIVKSKYIMLFLLKI